jgi:hypothetical protein
MMSGTPPFPEWSQFFAAQVDAAAALSGLVIVAISINLARMLEFPRLVGRAAETLVMLVGVLLVSSILLVPQHANLAGSEALVVSLLVWLAPVVTQLRKRLGTASNPGERIIARFLLNQAATIPGIAGSALALVGSERGPYFMAAGVLITLVVGVLNTWVLLVEVLR